MSSIIKIRDVSNISKLYSLDKKEDEADVVVSCRTVMRRTINIDTQHTIGKKIVEKETIKNLRMHINKNDIFNEKKIKDYEKILHRASTKITGVKSLTLSVDLDYSPAKEYGEKTFPLIIPDSIRFLRIAIKCPNTISSTTSTSVYENYQKFFGSFFDNLPRNLEVLDINTTHDIIPRLDNLPPYIKAVVFDMSLLTTKDKTYEKKILDKITIVHSLQQIGYYVTLYSFGEEKIERKYTLLYARD